MKIKQVVEKFRCLNCYAKIKGDAGKYHILGIDLWNWKLYVERNCGLEWVGFDKIQDIWVDGKKSTS